MPKVCDTKGTTEETLFSHTWSNTWSDRVSTSDGSDKTHHGDGQATCGENVDI